MPRRKKHLMRCMTNECLEVPDLRIVTTPALSKKTTYGLPHHWWPQEAHATTIGRSFFAVIWTPSQDSGQASWNHMLVDVNAPQPHVPDASEVRVAAAGRPVMLVSSDTPFHCWRKRAYQQRSDLNALFKRIVWWSSHATDDKSVILLRNVWPGQMTRQACDS